MSKPVNNNPSTGPNSEPKNKTAGRDTVTNADEAEKAVTNDNADGAIANQEGIEETSNESSPQTSLNTDSSAITDADIAGDSSVI